MRRFNLTVFCLLAAFVCIPLRAASKTTAAPTPAIRQLLVKTILTTNGDSRTEYLNKLADSGSHYVGQILGSWTRDEIYLYKAPNGQIVPVTLSDQQDANGKSEATRIDNGKILTDASGKPLHLDPDNLNTAGTTIRLRRQIQQATDTLDLAAPDPDDRKAAAIKLGNSDRESYVPALKSRLTKEKNSKVRKALTEAIALLQMNDSNPKVQVAAVKEIGKLQSMGALDNLNALVSNKRTDPAVVAAAKKAIESIKEHITWVNAWGTVFRGLSLGSILLVVALGLAITFGLMGIINMAHGEMIAVGAYTCYVVQNVFGSGFTFSITLPFQFGGHPITFGFGLPGLHATGALYQSYFLFAIPLSFFTAAAVGLILERAVIQFLYRRPLESLLATWGVSLVLQQLFRMVFGANNVQVDSPSWLIGHFSINDVSLGYNRVFVIAFAAAIVFGTWLLLTKTPLGLLIRSVMQNRKMASCMGVRTRRVNMLTFAFGSGLAGLAGAFLSQIGNVGPSLGQTYIVDSFMTVVVGGVGSIVGTVYSALGIGTADQVLQQILGSPVLGKIIVLACIILFLQRRPGGLFTTRSRNLDS